MGKWASRDAIEEQGGLNLYGMCGNDAVNQWDLLGQTIYTSENQEYRDAISKALMKVTDVAVDWCAEGKKWHLKKAASGRVTGHKQFWSMLENGLGAYMDVTLQRGPYKENASGGSSVGFSNTVNIQAEASVLVPVAAGNGTYVDEAMPFEILLWHELVGHSILHNTHPKKKWNSFEHAKDKPPVSGWGTVDPTIAVENQARAKLGYRSRRPQYWDTDRQMK